MSNHRVKEAQAGFKVAEPWPMPTETNAAGGVYRAKVFKSGNSLALRLPKALGLEEGSEMVLRKVATGYALELLEKPRPKLDVDSFWGKAKGMIHVPTPREDFEPRPSSLRAKP